MSDDDLDEALDSPDRPLVLERAGAVLRAMSDGDPPAAHAELVGLYPAQLRGVVLVLGSGFARALAPLGQELSAVLAGFDDAAAAAAADEAQRALDEFSRAW